MGQATIRRQNQCVILSRNAVSNLEDIAEAGVRPASSVVRKHPNLARQRSINDAHAPLGGWRIEICIDERCQVLSETEKITGRNNGIAGHLSLKDEITLVDKRH